MREDRAMARAARAGRPATVAPRRPRPVFTQCILADEIDRAPAKTQSALLEVMPVRHRRRPAVTGARPFMVLATQNPVQRTLPGGAAGQILLKVEIGYPPSEEEVAIVVRSTRGVQATTCRSHTSTHASPGKMLRTFNSALRNNASTSTSYTGDRE